MDNLNDIIASLSSDDINMLKGVASSILGEDSSNSNSNSPTEENNSQNALSSLGFSGDDFSWLLNPIFLLKTEIRQIRQSEF